MKIKIRHAEKTRATMIDVVIDLNLHHGGPSDGPSTRIYVYNRHIDSLAAEGTNIIANWTEKVVKAENFFLSNNAKIGTTHQFG